MQSEKAVLDDEPVDQAGAEGRIFAKWLAHRLSADAALLKITEHRWIKDVLVCEEKLSLERKYCILDPRTYKQTLRGRLKRNLAQDCFALAFD